MAEEKTSDDPGMTKYGVQPDTLTKEATQGVEDEEEVRKCVICNRRVGDCDHTRAPVKKD